MAANRVFKKNAQLVGKTGLWSGAISHHSLTIANELRYFIKSISAKYTN